MNASTTEYYLTPRPNRNAKNGVEVLGIRGYQGDIELMYRAGAVSSVVVEVVYQNDGYRYRRGIDRVPIHEFDPWARRADRGEKKGVYAYAEMIDGGVSRVVELNIDDIERAKAASPSAGKAGKVFWDHPDDVVAMWLKTGVHRLAKFVPTSTELRFQRAIADAAVTGPASALPGRRGPAAVDRARDRVPTIIDGGPAQLEQGPPEPPIDPGRFVQPAAPDDPVDPTGDYAPAAAPLNGEPAAPEPTGGPANAGQQRAIARLLGKHLDGKGAAQDPHRNAVYTTMLGRPIRSGSEVTTSDAAFIVDRLTEWTKAGTIAERIKALIPEPPAEAAPVDDTPPVTVELVDPPDDGTPAADPDALPDPVADTQAWHDDQHPLMSANRKRVIREPLHEECTVCVPDGEEASK